MKRNLTFLIVMFTAQLLFAQLPLKREVRGAWIATVSNIDWPSTTSNVETQKKQLLAILDAHKNSGINTVIFQVRPECDALYNSPYEPWSIWLTGTQGIPPNPLWDPLEFAVEEAHKRGMELHAWFNPYRAERSAGGYQTAANHVTKTRPEWILQVGSVRFLDPGLPQVRDYVTKIICDVVRRYDIDAAHMDDYFYVGGISTHDAATFAAYNPGGLSLGDWRRDNVNKLLKMVYDSIQIIKPWVKWGISPAGIWKNGVPSGISGQDNYSVLYCDPVAWLAGKYIDYLAPQLYWRIGGNQDFTKLLPWWQSVSNGRIIIPGLAAYRIGETSYGGATETASQIRYERATTPRAGNFIYTTNSLTNNLGGINDTLLTSLYKFPALIPPMNWKDNVAPNAPGNFRFGRFKNSPIAVLTWDVPAKASDNDTAVMYVVYQPDAASAASAEINDARNIVSVSKLQRLNPFDSKRTSKNFFVTALDRNNNESAPSNVITLSEIPATPVLALPVNENENLPPVINLTWNYAGASSRYLVHVADNSNFTSPIISTNVYDTVLAVRNLSGEKKYYWRVKGSNVVGDGSYSEVRSFTTGFPASPVLVSPADLLTNAPLTMQFSWQKNSKAEQYQFQLSRSSDFTNIVLDTSGVSDSTITHSGLLPFTIYFWRLKFGNAIGSSDWSSRRFRTQQSSSVAVNGEIPNDFALEQNYPNPFNPATIIAFSLKEGRFTTLKIYDVLGREIESVVSEFLPAGKYVYTFSSETKAGGIYFYSITAGSFSSAKKMILQK